MPDISRISVTGFSFVFYICALNAATAAPPELKTSEPVIYLKDNLDEKDRLGWCFDTLGRGFSEQIQAHSCKPSAEGQKLDVQFLFDPSSGQIISAAFENKCMEIVDRTNENVPFGLLDCSATNENQRFSYSASTGEFHPKGDDNTCISVATASRSAGPFMSRDLKLTPCAETDTVFKQWMIKD